MPAKRGKGETMCSVEAVGELFQHVHKSAAHNQKHKKEMLSFAEADQNKSIDAVCSVIVLVLKQAPQLTADVLKRHYIFLHEIAKAFRETFQSDRLTVQILRTVLPFHNANDKAVRLAVVSTFETLLKTVDQSNTSDERQDFYQETAEMLKLRIHDKQPQIREKAIASIAVFQTGKKDCDVAQQLIALLCTDNNADVRRQILRCIAPRKEFLEGYFHGMIRCVRDVVARVRAEAWDALSRFPWRYIVAYALAKNVKLPDLLFQGLTDTNASVVIACRAALTNCWVHRDNKDDCCAVLDPIVSGYVIPSLAPFHTICDTMLAYVQKRKPDTHFQLHLEDVYTSSLLMWRAECKVCSDREDADETLLLPPLEQFCAVLQDTIYAYARPDAEPKTVKFRNVEDADNMLRIFLSVFDIYEDSGYLSHVDNTTRNALLRLMNFLLKVVPDDNPALFVDVAVRSIKSLTVRVPEETTRTVTSALDSLFKSLKLPQRFGLGFDDVEALVRKSRERQQDLIKRKALLRSGEMEESAYTELKEEMDRDEKFLLRIQLIVLAFLSNSQRGDAIPSFCSHVIQLGRQQDNEKVKCAATKSLGLQCLISPDAVHTFVPLLLSDACQPVPADGGDCAPVAAIGVCFDLIMEYGLKFFDAAHATTTTTTTTATVIATAPTGVNIANKGAAGAAGLFNSENELESRLQHEKDLAAEDVHKVGSKTLLATLQSFLVSTNTDIFSIAVAGFCKLLSCNRIPVNQTPDVIAKLLVSMTCCHFQKKEDATSAYLLEYLTVFFRSYTSSHPKRQADFAEGGVTAFRVLAAQNVPYAAKVMEWVTHMSDAFTLTLIRDVDPEAATRLHHTTADGGEEVEGGGGGGAQQRTAAAKASLQSVRLLRELSRYSLHEGLAQNLLAELALNEAVEVKKLCLDILDKKMYFYAKDAQPFLLYCAQKAVTATEPVPELNARCSAFLVEIRNRFGVSNAEDGLAEKWDATLQQRQAAMEQLRSEGFFALGRLPLQTSRTTPMAPVLEKKRVKREGDFLDVDTIVGTGKRSKHY